MKIEVVGFSVSSSWGNCGALTDGRCADPNAARPARGMNDAPLQGRGALPEIGGTKMQVRCETQSSVTPSARRVTLTRRTLVRGHGLLKKPPKTSISVLITCEEWLDPAADLLQFDERLQAAEKRTQPGNSFLLSVSGPRTILREVSKQVFTRYQRLFQRRNRHSRSNLFTSVLARHRELQRLAPPAHSAEFDHALDIWQWVLRLHPEASDALQVAALFHHIASPADGGDLHSEDTTEARRTIQRPGWEANVEMLGRCLAELQLPREPVERAARLISGQDPADDGELDILANARALSFLAVNSSAFLRRYGVDRAASKVGIMVRRMNEQVRGLLPGIRLDPRVHELVLEALRDGGGRQGPAMAAESGVGVAPG
jgi:hypothetical protein